MSETDATVAVVGGGPAGLSAALFTQKNGLDTVLFDTDETWMHKAHLFNYLGIGSQDGSAYMETAREQVDSFGVDRNQGEAVTSVTETDDGFDVETEADDGTYAVEYVILATGANRDLADELGCEFEDDVVDVGVTMETSVENVYATGAMVRVDEWQAVISAGDGAAAALNILSKTKGENYHDFDVPADAANVFESVVAE
ncbi:oxidoreductase (homolog to thioredoxin-disulfide reductase) (plasmid) [Natrialba magadii ATCC 43099]|uniref:FAD-dependent pyridine nucleotide-disulfide oxidoreductase n=1 Tax=Natrialba magadii (strain ATCC 43099 / DSM 3394 / CCM 3739 / CIP 104546 / IAM 13178 / JCM 8861 / NBRC 102185 / NCIMB 2190 / MS3) TaxID=547559 RepID=D3T169_NATMM|nr:FAD-dependent oxidoreductase [Natrialba magadii]ADD07328.1 oxidoreductase (homolog to thioredoxin-disulfide reductase) [Natrialba magadii ATCC 43099]ELY32584.1 FAD-dependent pyridine nucleotide-disulfide oxidoreductase [Natrialba magadii ATCC 43099]